MAALHRRDPGSLTGRLALYGPRALTERVRHELAPGDTAPSAPQAALVVASRRRASIVAAPATAIDGLPVGVVHADRPTQLGPWLTAVATAREPRSAGSCVVCAMGKDVYLDAAARWLDVLGSERADIETRDARASTADRSELAAELATGPDLVVYLGHGRARGWSGYGGVRWPHVAAPEATRPVGVVIALACDTITPARDGLAFGVRWVMAGRAAAYVGAGGPLAIADGLALQARLVNRLATADDPHVGALLAAVISEVEARGDAAARRGLACLRLIGDPLATLPRPGARASSPQMPERERAHEAS